MYRLGFIFRILYNLTPQSANVYSDLNRCVGVSGLPLPRVQELSPASRLFLVSCLLIFSLTKYCLKQDLIVVYKGLQYYM